MLQPGRFEPGFFMDIEIRAVQPEDLGMVINLMREFAAYEKLLDSLEITKERLSDAVFGKDAFVEILVAAVDRIPAGYALFFPCFASFRGQRSLFLEDIYISSEYRGKGVGERLLREIAMIARSRGYERIDFQVLEWNTPAISFYNKLGAVCNDDERHFKFADEAFLNLAS
jgi:ribosomal protein S18 acetylase RimI-like enzyme